MPVLLYHSVQRPPPPGHERWTVTPDAFAAHADAIASSGRTPLTISELAQALGGRRPLPPRAVAVTFDDGFADNVDAIAALTGRGLRATLYVTTGLMGTPGMLDRGALAELASQWPEVELGAHAVDHVRLDELPAAAAAAQARDSRTALQDVLGRDVTSFAYPHGAYDARARAAVAGAGYTSAAAVKNALSHPSDDPLAIARWTVTADTTAARISEVLAGHGVPLAWRRERLRTRGFRLVRRTRRALGRPERPTDPARSPR